MEYTLITEQMKNQLKELITLKNETVDMGMIEKHPSYFMYHILGKKPFTYQHLVFHTVVLGKKRIAVCSSRQIGKSITCAVLALWAAMFNKYTSGIHENTKVCLVSKSDGQAKKLMSEIRKLIKLGDLFIKKAWGKENYVSAFLDEKGVQTVSQMDFANGSSIKSFPPTEAIRGETADIVIVDEAAFVDDEVYLENIKPTVSATNGIVILSSTPKGQSGFYYEFFDPFDKKEEHEYTRYWFPYWICESEEQLRIIEEEKKNAKKTYMYKYFQQEYEASFVVEATAFFESLKVDAMVDDDLDMVYEWEGSDCVLGLDYGITLCHTVITISTKVGKKTRLLYQYAYPFDENYDIISDIEHLMKKFPIVKIVADNGSPGVETNKAMKRKGWNVECYDFRSFQHRMSDGLSRNRGYYALRVAIHNELVETPRIPELFVELKGLQEVPMKINVAIQKPRHGFDDRADSMMMSMLPFITDDSGNFDFELVDHEDHMYPQGIMKNPREDELQAIMKRREKEARIWLSHAKKREKMLHERWKKR